MASDDAIADAAWAGARLLFQETVKLLVADAEESYSTRLERSAGFLPNRIELLLYFLFVLDIELSKDNSRLIEEVRVQLRVLFQQYGNTLLRQLEAKTYTTQEWERYITQRLGEYHRSLVSALRSGDQPLMALSSAAVPHILPESPQDPGAAMLLGAAYGAQSKMAGAFLQSAADVR